MDNGNGNGVAVKGSDGGVQTITLSEAPGTRKLSVDMDCLNLDVALALLQRATRELESRYRIQRAQELMLEQTENARMAAVAGDIMRRGPRGA